jgi:hypothetical protein
MRRPSTSAIAVALQLAALAVVAGCSSPGGGDPSTADCPTLSSACPLTPPSWENDVQPILRMECDECHGMGGGEQAEFDSASYDGAFAGRSEIGQVMVDCSMPPATTSPAPVLSVAQRQTVLSWVACNAPDN